MCIRDRLDVGTRRILQGQAEANPRQKLGVVHGEIRLGDDPGAGGLATPNDPITPRIPFGDVGTGEAAVFLIAARSNEDLVRDQDGAAIATAEACQTGTAVLAVRYVRGQPQAIERRVGDDRKNSTQAMNELVRALRKHPVRATEPDAISLAAYRDEM